MQYDATFVSHYVSFYSTSSHGFVSTPKALICGLYHRPGFPTLVT